MPITPVFEQPPVARHARQIDWQLVLDALATRPGDWAKVDGPFPNDNTGSITGRGKSLRKFAENADVTVETRTARTGDETWLYARTIEEAATKPAPSPGTAPAKKPTVAAVPNPPAPNADGDFGGGDHHCDTCGAEFRTNTRLRQHQANAHRAS